MARVHKSVDPTWVKWAVVADRLMTVWYDTEAEAQAAADLYNGKNL